MSPINYPRHFAALAAVAAAAVAASSWLSMLRPVAAFGVYGALHAGSLVAALRGPVSAWRRLLFVAAGASLCMLCVVASLHLSRFGGLLASPVLLLSLTSGAGAAGYARLIQGCLRRAPGAAASPGVAQSLGAAASPSAVLLLALVCMAATLAVFATGIYRHGLICFALAWWTAFSLGLLYLSGGARNPLR